LFDTHVAHSKAQVTEIEKIGRAVVGSNVLFFEDWKVLVSDRISEEGNGFKVIMHGMNAERVLIAAEALGPG